MYPEVKVGGVSEADVFQKGGLWVMEVCFETLGLPLLQKIQLDNEN